jgi:hypothetical protein
MTTGWFDRKAGWFRIRNITDRRREARPPDGGYGRWCRNDGNEG